ncbi:hypothetical protein KI387_039535, partial [Taxus chinensis]
MKVVAVKRDHLADAFANTARGATGETTVHSSQTPMRPYMTPMRDSAYDPSATPMHDGMRTPVVDRGWNACETVTPKRSPGRDDCWGGGGQTPVSERIGKLCSAPASSSRELQSSSFMARRG